MRDTIIRLLYLQIWNSSHRLNHILLKTKDSFKTRSKRIYLMPKVRIIVDNNEEETKKENMKEKIT